MAKQSQNMLADSAPMLAYLARMKDIADQQTQLAQLEALIASKQTEITEANAQIPDISHLTAQRQDLLADLAMGKTSEEEVAKLDSEIAVKTSARTEIASATKQIVDAAEHAIAGLGRRQEAIRQKIAELSEPKHIEWLIEEVLKLHAETLGAEYIKAANQVKELFMRLMAVDGFIKTHGRTNGIAPHCWMAMDITSFNLDACKPHELSVWPGNLFMSNILPAHYFEYATEAERSVLQAAGLDRV